MLENEKLENITIVIVGFKVQTENSVFYKKMANPSERDLGVTINKALRDNKCDFLSIRAISRGEWTT
jgi:hypothetical protein